MVVFSMRVSDGAGRHPGQGGAAQPLAVGLWSPLRAPQYGHLMTHPEKRMAK